MTTSADASEPQPRLHAVGDLHFDAENPRLSADADSSASQDEIFNVLWRDFAVDELASSIAANGFFRHEPLFAVEEGGKLVIVEGNRRLAALRALLLLDTPEAGVVLPAMTDEVRKSISEVPVVVTTRQDIWQYVGFKHVNGPQAWQSASKARYITYVRDNFDVSLDDIANQIGDRHSTVARLYRAQRVLEQAEKWDVFQLEDRWKQHFSFSHLYTGLDYSGIQGHIDVRQSSEQEMEPVPDSRRSELGELLQWLYGSKSRQMPPVVTSQNPDLRILDEVIQTKDGLAALRQGLPLRVSRDIGKGDQRVLREALVSAKASLQTARGKVITGFEGEEDLIVLGADLADLADAIHADMLRANKRARRHAEVDE